MARTPGEGRKRYIGFRVDMVEGPPPDRTGMVEALDRAVREVGLPDRRRLTVFTGTLGIAKCGHDERDSLVTALSSIGEVDGRPARVTTLATSGTIKNVKAHLGLDHRS
jgi:RNase P/RNase MRP subunit POP5